MHNFDLEQFAQKGLVQMKWSVYYEIYAVCEYIISAIHRHTNFMV